ncbi:MAG: hypothetical protein Q9187_000075 [Circinaria calcarea]
MDSTAIQELISSYHELNSTFVDELNGEPSPLEFARYIGKNRPFVVRGGISRWPAVRKWSLQYLRDVMKDQPVKVAITPHGFVRRYHDLELPQLTLASNADSAARSHLDESLYFVKPLEEDYPFCDFIEYVQKQEQELDFDADVKYSQSQNDNLRGEYSDLFQDVEEDIAWARIALDRKPEAINLWIGNSWSTTALHRDNYENIYCQVTGSKHFVLVPPVEFACINEWRLRPARYQRSTGNGLVEPIAENNSRSGLIIVPDGNEEETIPFAVWDPDSPGEYSTKFSYLSKPMRISLAPGDMLYLPALW